MAMNGLYLYCITRRSDKQTFGPMGIGGRGDEVYSVCYDDLAAVVSPSSVKEYPITRENLTAHERVLEEVTRSGTLLRVKFGTVVEGHDAVAAEEIIRQKVLQQSYEEFDNSLAEIENRVKSQIALDVKAMWKDMEVIYREILHESENIRRLKEKIGGEDTEKSRIRKTTLGGKSRTWKLTLTEKSRSRKIALGEKISAAVEAKRKSAEERILGALKPLSLDVREKDIVGGNIILNCAFLVEKSREKEFDAQMNELGSQYEGRIMFRYVGPMEYPGAARCVRFRAPQPDAEGVETGGKITLRSRQEVCKNGEAMGTPY